VSVRVEPGLQLVEVDQNLSTVTYTPPQGVLLINLGARMVRDGTTGARRPLVEVRDEMDVVRRRYTANVAPPTTAGITEFYVSGRMFINYTPAQDTTLIFFPELIVVPAGWDVHIRDGNAISTDDRMSATFTVSGLE
jgi:hypothetical protein